MNCTASLRKKMDNLPTIKQIIRQADWIGDTPMDDEESREWFERTCEENRKKWTLRLGDVFRTFYPKK